MVVGISVFRQEQIENDWRVPERDLKSCDSAMGLGAAPTFSARIYYNKLSQKWQACFCVWSCFRWSLLGGQPYRILIGSF